MHVKQNKFKIKPPGRTKASYWKLLAASLVVLLAALAGIDLRAQSRGKTEFMAGVEVRALVPIDFFTMQPITTTDSAQSFDATYSYRGGMGFGGAIRAAITPLWNIETGIYFTRRRFEFEIDDKQAFQEQALLRMVGYELPVKALVYIQMSESIFMDVALGFSADFFASDLEILDRFYSIRAFKRSWIQGAVLGKIGLEWRTDDNGTFYLGGSIHQPFNDIYLIGVTYYEGGSPPPINAGIASLDGAYFSVDFRYFLPVKKESGPKIKRITPN